MAVTVVIAAASAMVAPEKLAQIEFTGSIAPPTTAPVAAVPVAAPMMANA
jgi:hypothetical protein